MGSFLKINNHITMPKRFSLYRKAITFATKAHEGQLRKYTNEPYINHPMSVARILIKERMRYPDLICAAILHDVVEDTDFTIEDIEREFGKVIAIKVGELTDKYTKESYPNISRKERKLLEAYRISKISWTSKEIKLADLIDNTKSIVEYDPDFAKTYLKEMNELLCYALTSSSNLRNMAQLILETSKSKLNIS